MSKFRKKPVVIDAVEWTGENFREIVAFAGAEDIMTYDNKAGTMSITTFKSSMKASKNDWIIRGVQGEIYPCKPDIFAATYEAVPNGTDDT